VKQISQLQFITHDHPDFTHLQQVEIACQNGVHWVQLRLKNLTEIEVLNQAIEARSITIKYNVKLIINDYVNIAQEIHADGVHVGKSDTPLAEVRKMVGNDMILGGSTNCFEDILAASSINVDYLGLGPFRWTGTKSNLNPILGWEGYTAILTKCKEANIQIPIIAIGGILPSDLEKLNQTGIFGYAIASGLTKNNNFTENLKMYLENIR
jgi:thiamine-phosphate pyrophosphorylase